MPRFAPRPQLLICLAACLAVLGLLLGSDLTATSAGDLRSQISAGQSATRDLRSAIAADTSQIQATAGGLQRADARLAGLQSTLSAREAALREVQQSLIDSRDHLVDLENRLRTASAALAANLVARYENDQPTLMNVVLEARGFADLLEQLSFLRTIGNQDGRIIAFTRMARAEVTREVTRLGRLELRDRALTRQVLAQRNQVAAFQAALVSQQIAELRHRAHDRARWQNASSRLHTLTARLRAIEARAARERAAMQVNVGIAVDTGGMVQAPPGAPPAVAQVIAAGNAIATLPYVYGGGHASFHADAYDCSGSVSYALAAAGLVSAPMTSGDFESWGEPGPGKWITIYANAGHVWMEVGGWRFDTVAQASSGTRWAQGGGEFAGFVVRHPAGL